MAKEIKFNIRLSIDGKEQIVTATTTTKELGRHFQSASKRASILNCQKFSNLIQGITAASVSLKTMADSLNAVGDKLKEYNASFAKTSQLTGLSGKALKDVRNEAQAMADTFGEDFNGVIQGANSLAKSFGISIEEALGLMRDGLVSGANSNGEFIDTLKEYPRYFKEAGISAEDFVAITTNAAKQGIFSDKGVDAIKEGNLRIREMTTATATALDNIGISSERVKQRLEEGSATTFDIMREVGARLKELPASASVVGSALADIFGGPGEDAGLEYIKSLGDIQLNMEAVKATADDYSKSLGEQADRQAAIAGGLSNIIDLTKIYEAIAPALNVSAQLGATLSGITATVGALKAFNVASLLAATRGKLVSAATVLMGVSSQHTAAIVRVMSAAMTGAAYTTTALKLAIRGLLISSGVGIAIVALTSIVEALINRFSRGKESADDMRESMTEMQRVTQQSSQTFQQTLNESLSGTMIKFKQLQEAWRNLKTEGERKEWIEENASAFQELGLRIDGVQSAEDVFSKNTARIEEAFKKRAEAAAYAATMVGLYKKKLEIQARIDSRNEGATNLHAKRQTYRAGDIISGDDAAFSRLGARSMNAVYGAKGKYRINEQGAKELNSFYDGRVYKSTSKANKEDESALRSIDKTIARYADAQAQKTREANVVLNTPNKPTTSAVEPTTKAGKRGKATASDKTLREISNAQTKQDFENNIKYYQQEQDKVAMTSAAYTEYQKKIEGAQAELKRLQAIGGMGSTLAEEIQNEVKAAATMNETLGEEGNAVEDTRQSVAQYEEELQRLEEKQKGAKTHEQFAAVQKEIDEAQKAIDNIKGSSAEETENPLKDYADEIARMQAMTKEGLRLEIKDMGVDALTGKIKELQKLLANTPDTDPQRESILKLIEQYKEYRKQAAQSFDTMLSGWDSVKGVAGGINSITDALDGQKSAWESITGVIDGFIQLVQSIAAIVAIIDTLSTAMGKNKGAADDQKKATENAVTSLAATAVTTVATKAANDFLTKSYLKLAASEFFAAHAMIPFAGAGIASGHIAAMTAEIEGLNAVKLAKGGVVSGETLALVGEYAGASHNPEVVAPLDKLRTMIQPPQAVLPSDMKWKIEGRSLVGVMANETRISSKSGRRTGIRV